VIRGDQPRAQELVPAIPLERTSTTGVRHTDGAISMARSGPDSATSDFFICIGDQPELDFGGARNPDSQGFAAFGRVVSGWMWCGRFTRRRRGDHAADHDHAGHAG
jgi:peptidyl-prolyl cis-trans isomerase A (cyclophilin A)